MKSRIRLVASLLAVTGIVAGCSETPESGEMEEANLTVDPSLEAAALAKLKLIERELDASYLRTYGLEGTLSEQFLQAVKLEYGDEPELLQRRLQTIASAVIFAAPEVTTDARVGRITPFHGMTEAHYKKLADNEDFVFNHHMDANGGSPNGVRPFSVCETKYLIGLSKGGDHRQLRRRRCDQELRRVRDGVRRLRRHV